LKSDHTTGPKHLILYDGVCGLCDRLNRFVLARDGEGLFRFASIQGDVGRRILQEMGKDPDRLTTSYVVVDHESKSRSLLAKSDGSLFVLKHLGWPWKAAAALGILPRPFRDWCYDLVARHRYRIFGRLDACTAPLPEHRDRHLDTTL
jgi:predicted DCC family thiol-disulfide oxidoreductase YuxK